VTSTALPPGARSRDFVDKGALVQHRTAPHRALRRRLLGGAVPALLALALPFAASAQQKAAIVKSEHLPEIPKELEPVRESLARFIDYNAAEGEVYVAIGCVDYGVDNGAGKSYAGQDVAQVMVNYTLATTEKVDPMHPSSLIYARTPTGPLRLAGAIYTVPYKKGMERPKLFGQEFTGPVIIDGETPLQHVNLDEYELMVWLWQENPRGVFARTNPDLPCVSDGYSIKAQFHDAP
jgi:hypothetical protein